jgi:hypothetical protein
MYGNVLVRDYNGQNTALTGYSPFDADSGNLSDTLISGDGWQDVGIIDENGVSFDPKYTTEDLKAWQSRQIQRTDITEDQVDFSFTCLEATPIVDALEYQIPLASAGELGAEGYQITKTIEPTLVNRQILVVGVDFNTGQAEYFAYLFPLVKMVKPDKFDISDKNPYQMNLSWSSYVDPWSGFAVRLYREGPAWRNAGGTTTTPGAVTATIPLAPPTVTLGSASSGGTFTSGAEYWKVTTLTALGESTGSNEVTATLTANQQQVLNWGAVSGATGYRVYRGTSAGSESVLVTTINSGSTTTYTDTGTAGTAATVPTSNTTLGVTMPLHSALLTFAPPTSGVPPYVYTVQQDISGTTSTVSAGNVSVVTASGTSVSLVISSLTASTSYTFAVAATGDNGSTSGYSTFSNLITAT